MQPHFGVLRNARQTATPELSLGVARALENGVTLRLCISRGNLERTGRRASKLSGIRPMQTYSIYVIALSTSRSSGVLSAFSRHVDYTSWIGDCFSPGKGPVVILQGIRFPVRAGPTPCSAYDGPWRVCHQPSQPIQQCECIIARHRPDGHVILARRRDWLG